MWKKKISEIERLMVRIAAYISLLFILIAIILFGAFELIKFINRARPL